MTVLVARVQPPRKSSSFGPLTPELKMERSVAEVGLAP